MRSSQRRRRRGRGEEETLFVDDVRKGNVVPLLVTKPVTSAASFVSDRNSSYPTLSSIV